MQRTDSLEKILMLGKIEGNRGGWQGMHHQLHGHESEETPGDGEGQGSLAGCSPWGREESDMTYILNNNNSQWGSGWIWVSWRCEFCPRLAGVIKAS